MKLGQLIAKNQSGGLPSGQPKEDSKVEAGPADSPNTANESPPAPKPAVTGLRLGSAAKLGASAASQPTTTKPTGLKLGSVPKVSTPPAKAKLEVSDDLDLSALASLDTSDVEVSTDSSDSNTLAFPDEIEATAPVRELPDDLTPQQMQFVESLDMIYEVLTDHDMLGQAIRTIMQELQENKEYIKLVQDHDVHTMIKAIRNVMGITKIKKAEKSTRGRSKSSNAKASKYDSDTMAQLDAMMAGLADD